VGAPRTSATRSVRLPPFRGRPPATTPAPVPATRTGSLPTPPEERWQENPKTHLRVLLLATLFAAVDDSRKHVLCFGLTTCVIASVQEEQDGAAFAGGSGTGGAAVRGGAGPDLGGRGGTASWRGAGRGR